MAASPYHQCLLCEEVFLQKEWLSTRPTGRSGLTLRINAVLLRTYTQIHARSIKDKHAIYCEGRSVALNKMSWGGFWSVMCIRLGLWWHRSIFKWWPTGVSEIMFKSCLCLGVCVLQIYQVCVCVCVQKCACESLSLSEPRHYFHITKRPFVFCCCSF